MAVAATVALAVMALALAVRPGAASSAVGCGNVVEAGIVRAEGCFTKVGSAYETTQTADLNGIEIRATPTAKLVVNPESRRVVVQKPDGSPTPVSIAVKGLPSTTNPKPVQMPKLDFTAPSVRSPEPELVIGSADLTSPTLAGLNPLGTIDVPIKLTAPQDDGSLGEISFTYRLPGALTLLGHQGTVSVVAELFPGTGAVFDGIEIEASGLTIGGTIGVEDLAFTYRQSQQLFDGRLEIVFPRPKSVDKTTGIGANARVEAGVLKKIGLKASRLDIEIFPMIQLQSISADLEPSPFKFAGGVGFSAGEEFPKGLPIVGETHPISGDVNLKVQPSLPGQPTGLVELTGAVQLFEKVPIAGAGFKVTYYSPLVAPPNGTLKTIDFYGKAGLGLPRFTDSPRGNVLYLGGGINGWWEGRNYDKAKKRYRSSAFNFEGSVRLTILGWDVAGAQAVISDTGLGACVKPIWWSPWLGGGYSYRNGFSLLGGWRDCGLGRYRDTSRGTVNRELLWAGAAARPGADTKLLKLGEDDQTLRIEGRGDVPSFTLESRDGERIRYRWSGRRGPVFGPDREWVVLGDPQSDTAYVLMRDPGGRWAISGSRGKGAIGSVEQSRTLPTPRVKAEVVGNGQQRTLRWRAHRLREGDEIQFFEMVGDGSRRPIISTERSRGSHRFTTLPGARARHDLRAIVVRGHTPFEERRLDSYRVSPPKPPATPRRVRAERIGTGVQARWKRVPGARGYVVVLESDDGEIAIPQHIGPRRHRHRFADAPVEPRMKVKVYALGRLGYPSKPGIRDFHAIPPRRPLGRSADSMLRSAELKARGKLGFVAPCPGHGECRAEVSLTRGGRKVGAKLTRVTPESWARLKVPLPRELRHRLERGRTVTLRARGRIAQAGQGAVRHRKLRLRG